MIRRHVYSPVFPLKEPKYRGVCCEAVSPRNGYMNKTRTITISVDMLVLKGEIFMEPYL